MANDEEPMPTNFVGVRPPGDTVHLGDGAYAHFDGHHMRLMANHRDPRSIYCTGTVALEPGALIRFVEFARRYWRIT